MQIGWLTAFVDMPADRFEAGAAFWCGVTGSTLSSPRGHRDEFATLVPPDGDAYLRVQRVAEGTGGVHLDLHVESVPGGVDAARAAGATVVAEPGHVIMSTPAGFTFCVVAHHDETARPEPVGTPAHRVDQVCIDVPDRLFDGEVGFWSELTGWPAATDVLPEFASPEQPGDLPLHVVFQRLGRDDPTARARAHLDLACGGHVEAVRAEHERLGARTIATTPYWTTLADPAGLPYCLTQRDPVTGVR